MTQKIKFRLFTALFRFFAFLADKTNGWRMFVQPKLLFGTLIIGLGMTACKQSGKYTQKTESLSIQTNTDTIATDCDTTIDDSPMVSCYEIDSRSIRSEISSDGTVEYPDEYATYVGGVNALFQFLSENLEYPQEAINLGLEGRIVCEFIVKKDGAIDSIRIIKSIHPSLDKEAIRVIKQTGKWYPGKLNGEAVRSRFTLPIVFRLDNAKTRVSNHDKKN